MNEEYQGTTTSATLDSQHAYALKSKIEKDYFPKGNLSRTAFSKK